MAAKKTAAVILRERQIARARQHGIIIPRIAWTAAKREGLPYEEACAILIHESSGGQNVFGHDPTIWVGAGTVTKAKYLAYRKDRDASGRLQGVGSCQLTSRSLQDEADALGGCWVPANNCMVGFHFFAGLKKSWGSTWSAAYHYNGSGPRAEAYANTFVAIVATWRTYLNG